MSLLLWNVSVLNVSGLLSGLPNQVFGQANIYQLSVSFGSNVLVMNLLLSVYLVSFISVINY